MILPYYKETDEYIKVQHITENEYLDEPLIPIFITPNKELVRTIPFGSY